MSFDKGNLWSWKEIVSCVTPLLVFVLGIYINGVSSKIDKMDSRIDHHLTNDELHCPRSIVFTKYEFELYSKMQEEKDRKFEKSVDKIVEYIEKKR